LAANILTWLRHHRPKLFSEIDYLILEPSSHRQEWQRQTLKNFPNVRWHNSQLSTLNSQLNGVIFSNELLDAMPVHRYGWDASNKKWFEWGVSVDSGELVWAKIQNPEFKIQNPELEAVLPDEYTIETSPAAEDWWRTAAGMLENGKLLTIDYGHGADGLFSPSQTRGTLRAYHRHRVSDNLLANVGEQDLTAHVNFSSIQQAGEAAGLATENFTTQTKFLTQILGAAIKDKSFGEWNSHRTRQFQTLTHPEHLGRAFRVLVQAK
jgi:SAM-dependent MidA family methyltransferase